VRALRPNAEKPVQAARCRRHTTAGGTRVLAAGREGGRKRGTRVLAGRRADTTLPDGVDARTHAHTPPAAATLQRRFLQRDSATAAATLQRRLLQRDSATARLTDVTPRTTPTIANGQTGESRASLRTQSVLECPGVP
jgi:hypothetical protein